MNKEQFTKLESSLLKKGYRKYDESWYHEDYCLYKSIGRDINIWDEDRSLYQICLSIYDNSMHPEYHDRMPKDFRNTVSIEIRILVSRTVHERIDLIMSWHDNDTIEDIEFKTESFYNWACKEWPEPREEK